MIITRLWSLLQDIDVIGEIRSAHSYASAETLLMERTPDLVLLDINLGDRSGIDLLRFIHEHYPAVVVIMLSNQSTIRHRMACRELGAAYFIDKSTEFSQIGAVVTSFLQR